MISGYYFWDDYTHLDPNTSGNVPGFACGELVARALLGDRPSELELFDPARF